MTPKPLGEIEAGEDVDLISSLQDEIDTLRSEAERLKALVLSDAKALTAAERVAISLVRAHRFMKEDEGEMRRLDGFEGKVDLGALADKLKDGRGES